MGNTPGDVKHVQYPSREASQQVHTKMPRYLLYNPPWPGEQWLIFSPDP